MRRKHPDDIILLGMKDNETWNTCPDCNKSWKDKTATPGLIHQTRLCKECSIESGNLLLMSLSLSGDKDAVKKYCGSYILVEDKNHKLFRCRTKPPQGYYIIEGVYDKDGLLLPQYWSLPRLTK